MIDPEIKKEFGYCPLTGDIFSKTERKNVKIGQVVGSLTNTGYVQISFKNKKIRAHRMALYLMTDESEPNGFSIDHINRIRSDNRWANLRLVTHRSNSRNREVYESCYAGISFDKNNKNKPWRAQPVLENGKRFYIGSYPCELQAAMAAQMVLNGEIVSGRDINRSRLSKFSLEKEVQNKDEIISSLQKELEAERAKSKKLQPIIDEVDDTYCFTTYCTGLRAEHERQLKAEQEKVRKLIKFTRQIKADCVCGEGLDAIEILKEVEGV